MTALTVITQITVFYSPKVKELFFSFLKIIFNFINRDCV